MNAKLLRLTRHQINWMRTENVRRLLEKIRTKTIVNVVNTLIDSLTHWRVGDGALFSLYNYILLFCFSDPGAAFCVLIDTVDVLSVRSICWLRLDYTFVAEIKYLRMYSNKWCAVCGACETNCEFLSRNIYPAEPARLIFFQCVTRTYCSQHRLSHFGFYNSVYTWSNRNNRMDSFVRATILNDSHMRHTIPF